MNLFRKFRSVAAVALLLAAHGTANAGMLATSSVWASDSQLVYCTATNQSNQARPVGIHWVGEDGHDIQVLEFVEDPGRPAYRAITGRNQFVSCKFDLKDKPKGGYRANIFVVDSQKGVNVFYSDAN